MAPPTNDFISFCSTNTGTNLLSQSAYVADPQTPIGNQPGVARSQLMNKAVRQATYMAHCLGQFLINVTGQSAFDNATPSQLIATMALAWANPTGIIMAFGGTTVPTGYLLCDGSAVLRTAFSNLFSVIGTANGVGDGSSTFNLPDLRGKFLRGVDSGAGNDPNTTSRTAINGGNSGDNVGSAQAFDLGSHTHSVRGKGPGSGGAPTFLFGGAAGGLMGDQGNNGSYGLTDSFGNVIVQASGNLETRPINTYVYYIIKT